MTSLSSLKLVDLVTRQVTISEILQQWMITIMQLTVVRPSASVTSLRTIC